MTTVLRRLRVLEGIAKETLDNDKWKALWNKYSIETLNEPSESVSLKMPGRIKKPPRVKMFPQPKLPEKIETSNEPQKYPTRKQTSSIEEFVESNTILEKDLNLAEDYAEEEEKSQIF